MYYVYVLQDKDSEDYFYLGYTNNLTRRLNEHKRRERALSKRGRSLRLVYYEAYLSDSFARKRESQLKRNRRMKQFLLSRVKASIK